VLLVIFSGVSNALMWSPDDPNRPKVMPENNAMSSKSTNNGQEKSINNSNVQHITQSNQSQDLTAKQNVNSANQNYQTTSPDIFYFQMLAIFIGVIFSLFLFFKILRSR
jgi:hypothetical protein